MKNRYLLFILFALWGFLSHSQAFYLDGNGVTVKCPLANVGDTGVVGSTTYVKVDRTTLVASITASPNPADVATCCTSGIEDFSSLFQARFSFNQDISHWDTASATTMKEMFRSASVFNQNISNWCVTKILSEPVDFSSNSILEELYKPNWGSCPSNEIVASGLLTPYSQTVESKWILVGIDFFPGTKVRVFDKNGYLVYENENYNNEWGGLNK